jgi:CRISPR-associated endonuclease/helicase Cas3
MSSAPEISFDDFFREVWGYEPFPWQSRLASQVAREGAWPDVLDLPTGSGKTAALDVALFDFICDGGLRAPRRIVMVVDRRVIVDQIAQRAARLRMALANPPGAATRALSQRLRSIVESGVAEVTDSLPLLHTAVLRGATVRDDTWARYPHVPVLGASTVDQIGSRLLFRGYGLSDGARPIHAGLSGCDTLLLLDEVHLSRPFAALLEQLRLLRDTYVNDSPVPARFLFSQLSATPGVEGDVFRLGPEDHGHPELARRLVAKKPARLKPVKVSGDERQRRKALAQAAASAAAKMVAEGKRAIGVVVNRVDTARFAAEALAERDELEVRLLTGRMRPLDQMTLLQEVRDKILAGRKDSPSAQPFVLVATQCIEAGADFDFDGLVTECASLDALRQRFGRLDRRGVRSGDAVLLNRSDQEKGSDAVYGESLARTWAWLQAIAVDGDVVDMGIDALEPHLPREPELRDALRPPPRDEGVILPAHLDSWARTNPRPYADPDVATYLHGVPGTDERVPDVQVVWRETFERSATESAFASTASHDFDALPPGSLEALSLPPWAVRAWLASYQPTDLADVEGQEPSDEQTEGSVRPFWVRIDGGWQFKEDPSALHPGTTIIVPASYGGIGRFGTFDPDSRAPVEDLAEAVQLLQRGRPLARMTPDVAPELFDPTDDVWRPKALTDDEDPTDTVRDVAERVFDEDHPTAAWWRRAVWVELREQRRRDWKVLLLRDGTWMVSGRRLSPQKLRRVLEGFGDGGGPDAQDAYEATTEGDADAGSMTGRPVALSSHLTGVRDWAEAFGRACGLSERLVQALRWAGWIHDVGKADPRFQLMMHAGDPVRAREAAESGELLAKSGLTWFDRSAMHQAAARARYPRGQRHELVSLDMLERSDELRRQIEASEADWDLVAHLVASHHGWCRPLAPVPEMEESDDDEASVTLDGVSLSGHTLHRRERLDSGVARRFHQLNRRYGWHELAYLEALLRLADMRRSECEQRQEDDS